MSQCEVITRKLSERYNISDEKKEIIDETCNNSETGGLSRSSLSSAFENFGLFENCETFRVPEVWREF